MLSIYVLSKESLYGSIQSSIFKSSIRVDSYKSRTIVTATFFRLVRLNTNDENPGNITQELRVSLWNLAT